MSKASRDRQHANDDKRSLLEVALGIHQEFTGSACDKSRDDLLADVQLLELAVDTWEASSLAKGAQFDAAVWLLLVAAIHEGRAELKERQETNARLARRRACKTCDGSGQVDSPGDPLGRTDPCGACS